MRLTDLVSSTPSSAAPVQARDPLIAGLTSDSRAVEPGWLFAALPGTKADGRAFVAEAVRRGAVAVLGPVGTTAPDGIAVVEDENPRLRLARMAARFFGRQPATVAAVTGTNGKTSTAWWLAWALSKAELPALAPCALVGTLGMGLPSALQATGKFLQARRLQFAV